MLCCRCHQRNSECQSSCSPSLSAAAAYAAGLRQHRCEISCRSHGKRPAALAESAAVGWLADVVAMEAQ